MSSNNRKSLSTEEQSTDAQGQFTAAVDELLDQLQHKFDTVSREMFGKFDDMARRLDELEASLSVAQDAGTESTTPSVSTK
ncbi:heat shock factor-binding 1 family protein [Aspergillus lucknowensis]|uniref:Heat shock factor binding protein 1-domain-containing protein n=1 Tax=Aspergillus lucknowensis TaxID=176173 RepID=A0ABR4LJL8_9EURO